MSTWPNLDCGDQKTRVRTYVNEQVASFFTDTEIKRWLSLGIKDIAQKTTCVRRILDAHTTASTRTVSHDVYKVHHVEYVPATGRSRMLTRITPLQIGHFPFEYGGVLPEYWYEFGSIIGIDPLPSTQYNLRLYVSDKPKLVISNRYVQSDWTAGTGWTAASGSASHTGASGDLTYGTALVTATKYTTVFTISGLGASATCIPYFGSVAGETVTANGIHMMNATSAGTVFKFTGLNVFTIDDIYLFKESDYASDSDQTELSSAWQHLIVLFATIQALYKDKKPSPGSMLETILNNELAYLKQNIVDVIPDGSNQLLYQ